MDEVEIVLGFMSLVWFLDEVEVEVEVEGEVVLGLMSLVWFLLEIFAVELDFFLVIGKSSSSSDKNLLGWAEMNEEVMKRSKIR